jgi:thymidine kinase
MKLYPIEIIEGPMFCGKTTELLRRTNLFKHDPTHRVVLINYAADIRYSSDRVATHSDRHGNQSSAEAIFVSELHMVKDDVEEATVVGINEGQFFSDLTEFVLGLQRAGKRVIIAMLNSTFEQKPFHRAREELAAYSVVTGLTSPCFFCHKVGATASIRLGDSKEKVVIGGDELYKACCITCLHKRRDAVDEAE